jgi:predicted RecA/RadA family phage recombinase
MSVREQNLETIAPVLASFSIHQTGGVDDLKDADIGQAVTLTDDYEIGPCTSGDILLGKLVTMSLTDNDDGERVSTVQIGGICRLPITTTYPTVGDRVVGGTGGTVRQAPALGSNDPAGGNIARGTVLEVNGTTDCTILLN